MWLTITTPFSTAMPKSASKPTPAERFKFRPRTHNAAISPTSALRAGGPDRNLRCMPCCRGEPTLATQLEGSARPAAKIARSVCATATWSGQDADSNPPQSHREDRSFGPVERRGFGCQANRHGPLHAGSYQHTVSDRERRQKRSRSSLQRSKTSNAYGTKDNARYSSQSGRGLACAAS